jgi:hypothetical protein
MMTERPMMDRGPCSVSTLSSISTWQLPDASDCKFPRSPACRVSAPSFGPPETSGLAAECSSQLTSSKANQTYYKYVQLTVRGIERVPVATSTQAALGQVTQRVDVKTVLAVGLEARDRRPDANGGVG